MKYFKCQNCGAELEKENDTDVYVCKHCKHTYYDDSLDRANKKAIENLKATVQGVVQEDVIARKNEEIANCRQRLYKAYTSTYIDRKKVLEWSEEILRLSPNDTQATFYSLAAQNKWADLNAFLRTINAKEFDYLVPGFVDYLTNGQFVEECMLNLMDLIGNAFGVTSQEYADCHRKLVEADKLEKIGLFDVEIPRDVFVAYSSKDKEKAYELVEYLEDKGFSCFIAARNLAKGVDAELKYNESIKKAIDNCQVFLFVSSRNARSKKCDAYKIEMQYVKDCDIRTATNSAIAKAQYDLYIEKNRNRCKPRLEYLIDEYGSSPYEKLVKQFFGGLTWFTTLEGVSNEVFNIIENVNLDETAEEILAIKLDEFETQKAEFEAEKAKLLKKEQELEKQAQEERERQAEEEKEREIERKLKEEEDLRRKEEEENLIRARDEIKKQKEELEIQKAELAKKEQELVKQAKEEYERKIEEQKEELENQKTDLEIQEDAITIKQEQVDSKAEEEKVGTVEITSQDKEEEKTEVAKTSVNQGEQKKREKKPRETRKTNTTGESKETVETKKVAQESCETLSNNIKKPEEKKPADSDFKIENGVLKKYTGKGRRVVIPDTVTSIGDKAFWHSRNLTSVVIPNSVTSIGLYAFADCNNLARIEIPDTITTLNKTSFYACYRLANIKIGKNNPKYKDIDGNLYSKDGKTLIRYFNGKNLSLFNIPNSVTSIGDYAFEDCSSLSMIVIPNSVTKIGTEAFASCTHLTSIRIPASVTSISEKAFASCSNLTRVEISSSVAWIAKNAFSGCFGLKQFKVDKGNSKYKDRFGSLYSKDGKMLIQYAIGKKSSSFVVPSSVVEISEFAFANSPNLKSISIPDSVKTISKESFSGCKKLKSIKVSKNNPRYKGVKGDLYTKDGKTLILKCIAGSDSGTGKGV